MMIHPSWPAPTHVKSLITTRAGGVSEGPYASLNLSYAVGDDAARVSENRQIIQRQVPVPLVYMNQVHGTDAAVVADWIGEVAPEADAAVDRSGRAACTVMTADCLPVLLCDRAGTVVAAAHGGWRGLAAGVLEQTVAAMRVAPENIMAYFGPAIGPNAFEVGQDVVDAFSMQHPAMQVAFRRTANGAYMADIYLLARMILERAGVRMIYGGDRCTFSEKDEFFSYRRDGRATGRMVSAIWLEDNPRPQRASGML